MTTTTLIGAIAATAIVLGTLPAAAQSQRGGLTPRVTEANPQLERCIKASKRFHGNCRTTARGNPDLLRRCRYRLQQNVIGCRQRYR